MQHRPRTAFQVELVCLQMQTSASRTKMLRQGLSTGEAKLWKRKKWQEKETKMRAQRAAGRAKRAENMTKDAENALPEGVSASLHHFTRASESAAQLGTVMSPRAFTMAFVDKCR